MDMKYFLLRLIAPRSTFPKDMTGEERSLMQEHTAYWTNVFKEGRIVIFGPVADPKGTWGLGIVEVDDESELRELTTNDPVIKADQRFSYEIYPMMAGKVRRFTEANK
jgi:uncharacterized protein YciI